MVDGSFSGEARLRPFSQHLSRPKLNTDRRLASQKALLLAGERLIGRQYAMMRVTAQIFTLLVAALNFAGAAMAQTVTKPEEWQINLQPAATPMMRGVSDFHSFLLIIITLIVGLVLGLLLVIILRFNARANPTPSRTTHNTTLEVLWTVVPVLILVVIAIPSFRLLYSQRVLPQADMTVKVTGNKWYWSYEYPDHGGIAFDSNILSDQDAAARGEPRYLAVDNPVIVPVKKTVRVVVTASDVIHAWTIPSFGQKIDAVPGRLNEDWFAIESPGTYYGQCSELCGKDHAYMPVAVRAVPEAEFNAWVEKAKAAGVEEANRMLAAAAVAPAKLAQSAADVKSDAKP
jgi:cytochrome c oxidase subunit II